MATAKPPSGAKRIEAIIMGVVAVVFAIGALAFGVTQFGESSRRSDLQSSGIEVDVDEVKLIDQEVRRFSPNIGRYQNTSDDQVEFVFTVDGQEVFGMQPIDDSTFRSLRGKDLTARYFADDPVDAELLANGDFVAGSRPLWLFAGLCLLFALASGGIAFSAWRTHRST